MPRGVPYLDEPPVAQLRIEHRQPAGDAHLWLAIDRAGNHVGWFSGARRLRPRYDQSDKSNQFVIRTIEVAPGWRRLGVGTRLIEAMRADLSKSGVATARVLVEGPGKPGWFFQACGFSLCPEQEPRASWLTVPTARSAPYPRDTQLRIR